jgi:molybdate transport system permease protein
VIPADLSPLQISLATSIAATAVAFVSGIAAAAAMHRYKGRGRGLLDGILTLPLVLPPTVAGFFLLLLFGRRSPIGQFLEQFGLRIAFSWPATVIAASVVAFPPHVPGDFGGVRTGQPESPRGRPDTRSQ